MQYKIGQRVLVHLDETFLNTLSGDWLDDSTLPGLYPGTVVSTNLTNTGLSDYDWDEEYPLVVSLPSELFTSQTPIEYHRVSFTEYGDFLESPALAEQGIVYPTIHPYTVLKPVRP